MLRASCVPVEVHATQTRDESLALVHGPVLLLRWPLERHLVERFQSRRFELPGFCTACVRAAALARRAATVAPGPDAAAGAVR